MDDASSVTWMNQIKMLLPIMFLDFVMSRPSIKVADQAARRNPKDCGDCDHGH